MYKTTQPPTSRRQKAYLSILGNTQLHLRNPLIIAWWSAASPGLGHLLLSKYLRGFLLFAWEVFINIKAQVNLAILYSFTGQFELAKDILDIDWVLLYIPTYIFAIWDSYRTTVDMNKDYVLAAREDAEIEAFKLGAIEINYLDKRIPSNSFIWSLLMPGLGQIYIHNIISAFFILFYWIAIVYFSNLLPAIHFTFLGEFEQATRVLDPHWFLNIPSLYLFALYDSYVNTVENNNLYDWEQAKFLKNNYQYQNFKMPFTPDQNRGEAMYIVSTFEHSKYLELALTAIQMKGIPKQKILSVPMDKRSEERKLMDTIHNSDGLSLLDLPAMLGAVFMILGSIYGFVLTWGPILWALIGLGFGFCIGLVIKLIATKKYSDRQGNDKSPEVVLIIECQENQLEMVKETLWSHHALGVSKLSIN